MPIRYQTLLLVLAGLVVSVVRHGLETNWGPWGGVEYFLAWWLVHFMLLRFLFALVSFIFVLVRFIVSLCSRPFSTIDAVPPPIEPRLQADERRIVDRSRRFYDHLKAPASDPPREGRGVFWADGRLTSNEKWAKQIR